MAEVVAGAASLSNVDALAVDLDGVVYVDGAEISGAGAALHRLADSGLRLVFVTNNSTKTPEGVAVHLLEMAAYRADPEHILTSSRMTAGEMVGRFERAYIVGSAAISAEMERVGIATVEKPSRADAVVVGLDRSVTYDRIAGAATAVMAGAAFFATNMDPTYPTKDGLKPGGGAIAAAIAMASGVDPIVCGKPYPPAIAAVEAALPGAEILVVGDQPATDLAMGKKAGWRTALVLSGATSDVTAVAPELAPDVVVDTLSALADLFGG